MLASCYLPLLSASAGSTQDLVIVDHALLRPQQRHRRVRGVDSVQGPWRRRLCNRRETHPTVKPLWKRSFRGRRRASQPTQLDDGRRGRVPAALGARRHRHVVVVSWREGQAGVHQVTGDLPQQTASGASVSRRPAWAEPRHTHVQREASLRPFLPDGEHLPVKYPGVCQVGEEVAVGPVDEQHATGIIHRGDVRRLWSWGPPPVSHVFTGRTPST